MPLAKFSSAFFIRVFEASSLILVKMSKIQKNKFKLKQNKSKKYKKTKAVKKLTITKLPKKLKKTRYLSKKTYLEIQKQKS